jgi:DoxX-like family
MHTTTYAAPLPHPNVRAGTALTALPVLFLVFDSVIKLAVIQPVVDSFTQLGWPVHLSVAIGTLELICLALYLVPRTTLLGALLLTAYLGGAVATHARVESPLLTHTLFPVYVAVLLWVGLLLREPRLRDLFSRASASPERKHSSR